MINNLSCDVTETPDVRIIDNVATGEIAGSTDCDLALRMNDEEYYTPPTISDQEVTVNELSVQDVHNIMDCLRNTERTKFTEDDLRDHINNFWTLNAEVRSSGPISTNSGGQVDSGANTNVTNDRRLLQRFKNIKSIPIAGVGDNGPACYIKGVGYMDILTTDGTWMSIKTYYAPKCTGTIISPNAIVNDDPELNSWHQTSNMESGKATISFYHNNCIFRKKTIEMAKRNNLWYIQQPILLLLKRATKMNMCWETDTVESHMRVNISQQAKFELWHQRLLHPSEQTMKRVGQCVDGVPKRFIPHEFHHCDTCHQEKSSDRRKKPRGKIEPQHIGERFHMDYGFVSGKKDGTIIRSHDGYKAYLLIVDSKTRYMWIFLSKNKVPPIQTVKLFLQLHGRKEGTRVVRTDQGGELAKSKAFQNMIGSQGYTLETTGPDNSKQNGIVERPHRTLADMTRAAVMDAGLPSKFWSDGIIHAVYVKNRLPHTAFDMEKTPYEMLTGSKPDLSQLRIFGTPITTRKPGKRPVKLDPHCYNGIFLRYSKTMKNIIYLDKKTRRIKTSSYAHFDEAQYSQEKRSPGATRLFNIGFGNEDVNPVHTDEKIKISTTISKPDNEYLTVKPIRANAYIPTRGSTEAAGYDLYSVDAGTIEPSGTIMMDTGIAVQVPKGTYGRIASRSGLAIKHNVETKAGVIDPDYTGSIKVILHNFGSKPYEIKQGDRIAQLVLERIRQPDVKVEENQLRETDRGENGFGSTGRNVVACKTETYMDDFDLMFSTMEHMTTVTIEGHNRHPTMGIVTKQTKEGVQIVDCILGTPSTKIPKWKHLLKYNYVRRVDGKIVNTVADFEQLMREGTHHNMTITTKEPVAIHPLSGIPQLHYDQLGLISKIHHEISKDEVEYMPVEKVSAMDPKVIHKAQSETKLTRRLLRQQSDWDEWKESEKVQLDLYEQQGMFGKPGSLPTNGEYNVLPMIWSYLIKTCGRKKARCVANGAPHLKGSVTLANTYAACLEQTGARIFWSLSALHNRKVYGADASNAFAEAPPPKAPLYLRIDDAYKEWYESKTGLTIPAASYVQVFHAIQGHPEAPRLWQDHIDGILRRLGFKPTTKEPCVYIHKDSTKGHEIYLLRQVDDFAIACDDETVAEKFWRLIDSNLSAPLKREGLLQRHNGIDIEQSSSHIKIHCETYISKIVANKPAIDAKITSSSRPTPMKSDPNFHQEFDNTVGPIESKEKEELEREMGIKYRQATGELLFAMVTCRPDISFAVLKLTQHNNHPARIHYESALDVYRYLKATKQEGIQYERTTYDKTLPDIKPDVAQKEEYNVDNNPAAIPSNLTFGYVDSDWAANSKTRRSVSGIAVMLAGAVICYKTIYQKSIALSSTEAELYALSEAAKTMLYIRNILEDLMVPQDNASILYEDNQGCVCVAESRKPTRRTRHVDIRHFALVQWVEEDIIAIKKIHTNDNASDTLTKALPRILFHRHNDTLMGRHRRDKTTSSRQKQNNQQGHNGSTK